MSNKVIGVGETVYDIIFKNGKPVAARPGGSMLNTAVSLGRLGIPVYMLTEYGNDPVGKQVDQFLNSNGVNTGFVTHYEGKTRISTAFLNENGDADYNFYPGEAPSYEHQHFPEVNKNDIILFGSFYSLKNENRNKIDELLYLAKQNEAIIYYDPNFRKPHLNHKETVLPVIHHYLENATLVRGSNEDFELLLDLKTAASVYKYLKNNLHLIYTHSYKGVDFMNSDLQFHQDVPQINPLSTIGAGDSFNAGIIYGILQHMSSKDRLIHFDASTWEKVIDRGIACATDVCMSMDNYISQEFVQTIKHVR
ncbi:MAG: carbohydrate kinase [Bacteroidales bacterium]|nr:carbohydrate kinase [Bacteroidales bacterium]